MTTAEQGSVPAWMTAPTVVISLAQLRGCDGQLVDTHPMPLLHADSGQPPGWASAATVIIPRSELGLYHRKVRGDYASELAELDADLVALGVSGEKPEMPVAQHPAILLRAYRWCYLEFPRWCAWITRLFRKCQP